MLPAPPPPPNLLAPSWVRDMGEGGGGGETRASVSPSPLRDGSPFCGTVLGSRF